MGDSKREQLHVREGNRGALLLRLGVSTRLRLRREICFFGHHNPETAGNNTISESLAILGRPEALVFVRRNLSTGLFSGLCTRRPWSNVLITSKEVVGIILRLYLDEAFEIVAVGRFYSFSAFFHHKINVGATEAM